MLKYLLYIFDVDGTLIDSRESNTETFRKVFRDLGMSDNADDAINYTGQGLREIFRMYDVPDIDQAVKLYSRYYTEEFYRLEKPFPGIIKLLDTLKGRVLLSAATNRGKWKVSSIIPYFDIAMSSGLSKEKPDRDMFDQIIAYYAGQGKKLELEDCLMIGDSPLDMEFAGNCGIDSAFVEWGFFKKKDLTVEPTYIICQPKELSELNERAEKVEISEEIDLHTFKPQETKRLVEDYLVEAKKKNYKTVRIIHGKGKGVQRKIVHSALTGHRLVKNFYDASVFLGGLGATVVEL